MKKSQWSVIIACALTLCLLLAGCGAPAAGSQSPGGEPSGQSQPEGEPAPEALEPVTISILVHGAEPVNGIQTDAVAEYVKEKTGITLDIISDAGMNLTTELNTMIASDSLPDIVCGQWIEQLQLLLDNDAVIPLDDMLAERGGEITNKVAGEFAVKYSKQFFSNDTGNLYFIPLYSGMDYSASFPGTGPYIRWDVYESIGKPPVQDMYDLLDVLKQMQDAYPETEDGKKVYAISGFLADVGWNTFSLTAAECFTGFRKMDSYGYLGTTLADSGKMINGMDGPDAPTWELFRFYNKAYQMGILDPEAVTMKFDQWNEKLAAGQVLYSALSMAGVPVMNDENKTFLPVKFEEFTNDSFTSIYGGIGYGYGITSTSKNPERAMDLLNLTWSYDGAYTIMNGVEGDTWEEVDGVKRLKADYVQGLLDGTRTAPPYRTMIGPMMDERTNTPINLQNTDDYFKTYKQEGVVKEYCDFYGVDSPIQLFTAAKYNTWDGAYEFGARAYTDDLQELNNRVQDYALTNLPRLVVAESDEEFETMRQAFMDEINAMGVEQLLEYKQGYYEELGQWMDANKPQ